MVGAKLGAFVTIITVGTLSCTLAYWLPPLLWSRVLMAAVVDDWVKVASKSDGVN